MSKFKEVIKTFFPFVRTIKNATLNSMSQLEKHYYIYKAKKLQERKLEELKGKNKIKCVILLFSTSLFRDYLYQLLASNERFEVFIVVSPECSHGEEYKKKCLQTTYENMVKKGYSNVLLGYDIEKDTYLDIKKEINPDIIIYTNPYRGLISEEHYVTKFLDCLPIYIPYYINNTVEYKMAYDELLHNVVWRYYVETEWHKKLSKKYSTNCGRNVVVTGYSGIDRFLDKNYRPSSAQWKIEGATHKRIIWAPHQTIDPSKEMYYSAFLFIADEMTNFAKKYKDQIQIAFKPHPLLVNSLYKVWGKERTDAYYDEWRNMDNTCIVEGEYADLFLTSDAIIHDSASFITEYLMINKPALRTYNERDPKTQFNDFSLACLDHYYKAYNAEDVEKFIKDVVKDNDPMKEARTNFIQKNLLPPQGGIPSENIIADILLSIDNQILYK